MHAHAESGIGQLSTWLMPTTKQQRADTAAFQALSWTWSADPLDLLHASMHNRCCTPLHHLSGSCSITTQLHIVFAVHVALRPRHLA